MPFSSTFVLPSGVALLRMVCCLCVGVFLQLSVFELLFYFAPLLFLLSLPLTIPSLPLQPPLSSLSFYLLVPNDTLIMGNYKSFDNPRGAYEGKLSLVIKDPHGKEIQRLEVQPEGKFAFTSHEGGEHLICWQAEAGRSPNRQYRVEMNIDTGDSAHDYEELAKMEHLSAIEVEVRKLGDKVHDLRSEQAYQRIREEDFRDVSESTNSMVLYWGLFQTVLLVAAGVWQVSSLSKFFKSKKLA